MILRYRAVALAGLAAAFTFAFAVSFLDPRTPGWGYALFGVPAALLMVAFVGAARRYLRA